MAGSWNIDVPGAAATIQATAAQVESVQPSLEGMGSALQQAAAAIPGEAAVVISALEDVLSLSLAPAAQEVVGRSGTIITSTVQALNFYQQGDLDMAAAAQRSAAAADLGSHAEAHGGPSRIPQ
jgi:hypothetical protein